MNPQNPSPKNPEDQIILVDKPADISSFGVVAKIRGYMRKQFGKKVKVGHTGTLDPFATGLLIILTGKNTKKSDEFLKKDKVYEAELKLGFTSTTGDPEGEITKYSPKQTQISSVENLSKATAENEGANSATAGVSDPRPKLSDIEFALQHFVGVIDQTPPRFSAIKINGERAYKLARQNKDFTVPSRKVEIYDINLLSYRYPFLKIRCHVSSGTYIRTLAEDIGEKLGTGAYLTALRRLKIADYSVEVAHPLSNFTEEPPEDL